MGAARLKAIAPSWRWALASVAFTATHAAAAATPLPSLLNVRFGGDLGVTRLVIDVDRPIPAKAVGASTADGRIVLTLPPMAVTIAPQGPGRGRVKAWFLETDASGARLVLDLAAGGAIIHRFLLPPVEGSTVYRYVVDIGPTPPRPPFGAMAPPPTIAREPVQARSRLVGARKVIVVDAGHGGHDPGALGATRSEKDITLAAARALKTRLERMGRYRVVLTRDADAFIPLDTRVRIARRAGADLFISLHADSAGLDPATHGASVYTLSDSGETRVNYVLGDHEWFTRAGARSDPAVSGILLDLTQRNTRNRSATFAAVLLQRLADRVGLLPRSQRDAGYFVLLAPDVPAALLEMGFITNPQDEARLADPAQRDRLMDVVAEAIDAYFTGDARLAAR